MRLTIFSSSRRFIIQVITVYFNNIVLALEYFFKREKTSRSHTIIDGHNRLPPNDAFPLFAQRCNAFISDAVRHDIKCQC